MTIDYIREKNGQGVYVGVSHKVNGLFFGKTHLEVFKQIIGLIK